MFMRFVKFTCMYFDSKKDQDIVYLKNTCSRYDMLITVLLSCMSCIMFFIQLLWLLYIYIYISQHITNCLFEAWRHAVVNCGHPLAENLMRYIIEQRPKPQSQEFEKGFLGDMAPPSRQKSRKIPESFCEDLLPRKLASSRFSASMNYFAHFPWHFQHFCVQHVREIIQQFEGFENNFSTISRLWPKIVESFAKASGQTDYRSGMALPPINLLREVLVGRACFPLEMNISTHVLPPL